MKTVVLLGLALILAIAWVGPSFAQDKTDRGPISWVMEDLPNYVIALKKVRKDPASGKDVESYFEITVTKDTAINALKPEKGSFRDLQPGAITTDIVYTEKEGKATAKSLTLIPAPGGD